jgi:hypothetical protein
MTCFAAIHAGTCNPGALDAMLALADFTRQGVEGDGNCLVSSLPRTGAALIHSAVAHGTFSMAA